MIAPLKSPIAQRSDLEQLVGRCRKGDQLAWKHLVDHFSGLVYSVAKRQGLSEDESADVFQSTFLSLYQNLDRIESTGALPKWIAVTAANAAYRTLRANRTHSSRTTTGMDLNELVASEEASAEEEAVIASQALSIRTGLKLLGGKCARLLSLLYLQESTYDQVCEELGMPMGSLGPTRSRCLAKLRKILEDGGFLI